MGAAAVSVELPLGVRCAVALSYDLEMCAGYAPDGINHGRIMPAVRDYAFKLCDTAEKHGLKLQFFHVGNGLISEDVDYLREILRRGHLIDSHTFSHLRLATSDVDKLDRELALTNQLLQDRLGWRSTLLRGPGGEPDGLNGLPQNQDIILKNGFMWVSCHRDVSMGKHGPEHDAAAPGRLQPYAYPAGLVELPIQGWMDRSYFDVFRCVDSAAYARWRGEFGHRPVPQGWKCPWTATNALDGWIRYNLAALDYAYANRLLWVPTWHPYSHYLHDPDNRMLPALIEHARSKPEGAQICTLRDAVGMLASARASAS